MFRDVFIDTLKSLKQNRDPLLATMNVFIQEPTLDWLENSKLTEIAQSNNAEWYPLQKIIQAEKKLNGAHSRAILIEDLRASPYRKLKPEYFEKYISYVEGDSRLSLDRTFTVEEQVNVLIDHATDQNLLGRMYVGWRSYI
ncbi:DNA-dependent protein kinase catalytic subunit-like [Sitophilus oryzae]|uniref:DNA-dependent protein kinase catalytic subunit-like n=1 Tax=Sitophilus oryzae TaxID=7048 RepID=A0A6J2Y6U0_SITOR|nr:DNA-dependent protein kinase catalytic subunit-like [Sitophilus oryzae]